MKRLRMATAVGVLSTLLALASAAAGAVVVSTEIGMPVTVTTSETATGCTNSPGPVVTLSGELALGGLSAELIFRNNAKGTHEYDVVTTATVEVIPAGESIQIPKQPVQGGVGGNPFIWIQFTDADGNALSGEIFLGRCVQGLDDASADLVIPSLATATVTAGECTNNPGPYITISGELSLSGINANLIFRNNDNPVGGPHENDQEMSVTIVLIPSGTTIQFNKQPVLGGVGGNPWISLVFLNGSGQAISDEILLGRCVQDF